MPNAQAPPAGRRALSFPRRRSPLPIVVWLIPIGWAAAGDWLGGAGVATLWAIWRFSPQVEGPPVIPMALSFQWCQVAIGIYYHGLTGRVLPPIENSDYRPMLLMGLVSLLVLVLGLRGGFRFFARRSKRPTSGPSFAFTPYQVFVLYASSVVVSGIVREVAWGFPALTQGLLALTYLRLALLLLLVRRLSQPRLEWRRISLLVGLEILLGFMGYFASFKEPLVMAAVALYEAFDRRRKEHWIAAVSLGFATLLAGYLWMGIRSELRKDIDTEVQLAPGESKLGRVASLSTDFAGSGTEVFLQNLDFFVDRIWAIYYPALAVSRVPLYLPHENGALLKSAVLHVVMPRAFFPDKPDLPSDSALVRKYSGLWVAGEDESTNIAFGYLAESYVDFGLPFVFAPVLVFGFLMGAAYHRLLTLIRYRELAVGLVTVVFWLALYQFERSWGKTLGLSGTLLIYLGAAVFAADRYLLVRGDAVLKNMRSLRARPRSKSSSISEDAESASGTAGRVASIGAFQRQG